MVKTYPFYNRVSIETNIVFRKIKYQFTKRTLNTLYCTYIRPLLEYASEVWGGSTQADTNRLEQIQLNPARIATGLPVFASLNSLYYETGWRTLSQRRPNKKLTLVFKIVNTCNEASGYLKHLLPNRVGDQSLYQLRNNQNYEVPYSMLCSYRNSYSHSIIRRWNELDQDTVLEFKNRINVNVRLSINRQTTCYIEKELTK